MRLLVNDKHEQSRDFILSLPERYARGEGELVYKIRNEIRLIDHDGLRYVCKRFAKPHIINRYVYARFRTSKAQRSYMHSLMLRSFGVGTPEPVGFIEYFRGLALVDSFYVSLLSGCDHTYADLFAQDIPFREDVVRQVARVTARLHEHGVLLLDHSRGNILFKRLPSGEVLVDLVDLNRMHRGVAPDIRTGCKNFERLPATPEMHRWMAEEYAIARGYNPAECYELMQHFRDAFGDKLDGKW